MSKLPSMPFFVDAYLADTTHLSLEEHGAYMLLLFAMWRRNGVIPDDDRGNARMLGITLRTWLRLKPRLLPFLEAYAGQLTQKRLQKMWNFAVENRQKQSERGKAGVKVREERKQLLSSSRGLSPRLSASASLGNGASSSASSSQAQATIKKEDITSTFLDAAREEPDLTLPECLDRRQKPKSSAADRLLNTPAMKRAAAKGVA